MEEPRRRNGERERGRYKMGTIARLTSLTPAVLRAWERRFDLLDPERAPSGHRLYTESDLLTLRGVGALLEAGRSIGEIARMGRRALVEEGLAAGAAPTPARPRTEAAVASPSAEARDELERLRAALVAGAIAVDAEAIGAALDRALTLVSPPAALRDVVQPAAREVGEAWAAGRCTVAGEHLFSALCEHRLRRLFEDARVQAGSAPEVFVGCLPEERHELGALLVAYHLSVSGSRVTLLGADLPLADLERACAARRPRGVLLSVTRRETYDAARPALLVLLRRLAGTCAVVIGGQGAPAEDAPAEELGARFFPPDRPLRDLAEWVRAAIAETEARPARRRRAT